MLAAGHRNLTVVGDDDQSIFRFRGASLSNILEFEEVFPEAKRIVLTRNYRSTQSILDASYRLIRHNDPNRLEFKDKIDKRLKAAARGRGKSIHMLDVRHALARGRRRGRPRPRDPRPGRRLAGHRRARPAQRRRRSLPAVLQHEADPLPLFGQPRALPAGGDQGPRRLHPGPDRFRQQPRPLLPRPLGRLQGRALRPEPDRRARRKEEPVPPRRLQGRSPRARARSRSPRRRRGRSRGSSPTSGPSPSWPRRRTPGPSSTPSSNEAATSSPWSSR